MRINSFLSDRRSDRYTTLFLPERHELWISSHRFIRRIIVVVDPQFWFFDAGFADSIKAAAPGHVRVTVYIDDTLDVSFVGPFPLRKSASCLHVFTKKKRCVRDAMCPVLHS